MYLSINHLCFYSFLLGREARLVIRWTDVTVSCSSLYKAGLDISIKNFSNVLETRENQYCSPSRWDQSVHSILWGTWNFTWSYGNVLYICQNMQVVTDLCKPVVTRLSWSRYQDVLALLVPSCCDKSGTSCYHLFTRLMTVTDLLQVVPTRLTQAVRNKLLRACCHQLVNNLLRADDIKLVRTTSCESVGLINLVTRW
jgi:hypothetical protein